MVQLGVFLPNGKNGSLISANSPQYSPTWELNKEVTLLAEEAGFEIALSMVKFRGFGGKTGYWDEALESFTLTAGLAQATRSIQLIASVGVLAVNPAFAARMATTIDAMAPGRFGLNIVSGWQMAEYDQMGAWPGQSHYERRYEYCGEYVAILKELWETGASDRRSDFFAMKDCRLGPLPSGRIPIVCAGQSAAGVRFAAEYGDWNFCSGTEINDIETFQEPVRQLRAENERLGRNVKSAILVTVIMGRTDAEAQAKWQSYVDGTDLEAIGWRNEQSTKDVRTVVDPRSHSGRARIGRPALPNGMSRIIGSYGTVARELDRIADVEGVGGIMLAFDDYIGGMKDFARCVQPLMRSRRAATSSRLEPTA